MKHPTNTPSQAPPINNNEDAITVPYPNEVYPNQKPITKTDLKKRFSSLLDYFPPYELHALLRKAGQAHLTLASEGKPKHYAAQEGVLLSAVADCFAPYAIGGNDFEHRRFEYDCIGGNASELA